MALSHPEVSFKFVREGKLQYVTPGDGQLRGAAYSVLGREFSRDLIELENQEGVYRITGLITPPKSCRASRSMQHFYINGRYVRNRTKGALGRVLFEELHASGGVVEKITHGYRRALRAAAGAHVDYIARLHGDFNALGSALFTGRELDA